MLKVITFFTLLITGCIPLFGSIQAEEALWGFDGKIVEHQFNMVSIHFSNPSPEAFEGEVRLQKMDGIGGKLGAQQTQHLFLGPFAHRWVQFYPYLRSSGERWICSWGSRKGSVYMLDSPRKGPVATVFFLTSNSSYSLKKIHIKPFPEHLFPPSVSLTDGLRAAVLEDTPEFTPVQNEAFINWIKAGGKLFLLPDNNGVYPRFQGKSTIINSPAKELKIGLGVVKKLPRNINFVSATSIGLTDKKELKPKDKGAGEFDNTDYRIAGITDEIFRKLRYDVKTNHNWGLIAFVTVIYLILIVVVNFIIARKTRKVGPPLIFFALTVFLFSLLFSFIGRRGYGEKSQITSISFARSLGDGNFDVSQWMNIFVTSGDYYRISHPANTNFYSTCQTMEQVNGLINNGVKGEFLVDIPLFSSRSLFHRGMMTEPKAELKKVDYKVRDGKLVKFNVDLSRNFPGKIQKAYAIYKDRYYELRAYEENYARKITLSGSPKTMAEFLQNWKDYGYYNRYNNDEDDDFNKVVETMVEPIIIRHMPKSDEVLNLYILVEAASGFKAIANQIKSENGFILYNFKLKGKNE